MTASLHLAVLAGQQLYAPTHCTWVAFSVCLNLLGTAVRQQGAAATSDRRTVYTCAHFLAQPCRPAFLACRHALEPWQAARGAAAAAASAAGAGAAAPAGAGAPGAGKRADGAGAAELHARLTAAAAGAHGPRTGEACCFTSAVIKVSTKVHVCHRTRSESALFIHDCTLSGANLSCRATARG